MITEITFFDSLVVTLFSMIVVFSALVVIALIIDGIKLISSDDKKKQTVTKQSQVSVVQTEGNDEELAAVVAAAIAAGSNEELVAVIAAAIAASLGVSTQDINIKTIRRLPQNSNPWRITNRQEQLYGKL